MYQIHFGHPSFDPELLFDSPNPKAKWEKYYKKKQMVIVTRGSYILKTLELTNIFHFGWEAFSNLLVNVCEHAIRFFFFFLLI